MRAVVLVQKMRRREHAPGRSQIWGWKGPCACALACILLLWLVPATAVLALAQPLEVPYFLPVDISEVEVSVTTTATGEVARILPSEEEAKVDWKFSRSVSIERAGTLALKTVADPSASQVLLIPKATWSDVKATIELTESGFLAGINASAAGRGDDVLLAVAKFAGVATGFWTGSPLAGATVSTRKHQAKLVPFDLPAALPSVCPSIEQLEAEGVPVEMQALVSLDSAGCTAFLRLREATEKVEAMRIQRDHLAELVPGASGAELTELNRKLQSYRLEVSYAEAIQAQRRAALATAYDRFAAARCLGVKVRSTSFHELLPLDRMPSAVELGWLADGANLSRGAVKEALKPEKWRESHDLFREAGVVVTLDDAPVGQGVPKSGGEKPKELTLAPGVAWRQPVPVRVRIWTLVGEAVPATKNGGAGDACKPLTGEESDVDSKLEVSFESVLDVLHPHSPVRTLPIETKAFADRSLAVTFDPRGRPRKIDTSGSSSVAGFAQAAAAAAQGFRDEYDATLKKRVSIEESRRELALDGLNDKIAALEAQKEELDARAQLLAASGSFDDLVARQKLDSELRLFEAQVALRTAEATAEHRIAIAELEKRVLETQKRLALLEAEQALEETRRRR